MAACLSNSTECLLRAILNTKNTFDWNPPSFGATVAIGFLALLIAITTVFQATLGASPGRLKASKRAIGPFYSKIAKTRFSPTELRFRTIAWVPFIDQIEWSPQKSNDTIGKPVNSIYGAGWLNLVQPIPIECQKWFATPCQTDYLPADVLAAPARASVGAIVQLAVLGGCDSVEIVSDFPLVKGRGAQLSFREHPYLGCIAVFDQYLYGMQIGFEAVKKRDLLYLQGQMSFQGVFMKALLFDGKSALRSSTLSMSVIEALNARRKSEPRDQDQILIEDELSPGKPLSLMLGLLTWDSLSNCRGLPYSKIYIRRAALLLLRNDPTWHSMNKRTILRSLYNLLSTKSTILAYDTSVPYGTGVDIKQQHIMLGWTWLFDEISNPSIDPNYIDVLPKVRLSEGKRPWFEWRPGGVITEGSRTLVSGDGNLLILPSALDICLTWLESNRAFQEIAGDEKDEARSILEYQLHEVDFWLLKHGGARSADCVFQLLSFSPEDSYFPGRRHYPWGRERRDAAPKTLTTALDSFPETGVDKIMDCRPLNSEPSRTRPEDSQIHIRSPRIWHSSESLRLENDDKDFILSPDEISIPGSPKAPGSRPRLPKLLPAPENTNEEGDRIPPNARWTKIDRRLVNPQALEEEGLIFEERLGCVIVLRVLTKNEIQMLAELTYFIRQKRSVDDWLKKRIRGQTNESKDFSSGENEQPQSFHELSKNFNEESHEDHVCHDKNPTAADQLEIVRAGAASHRSINEMDHIGLKNTSPVEPYDLSDQSSVMDGEEGLAIVADHEFPKPNAPSFPLPIPEYENIPKSIPSDVFVAQNSSFNGEDEAKADAGMKTLLIYRVILFAALGALAADTSCIFETELGRRIVQVL